MISSPTWQPYFWRGQICFSCKVSRKIGCLQIFCYEVYDFIVVDLYRISSRSRGGSEGLRKPPFETIFFIFMENFQKNQEKIINNQVKLTNRTPPPPPPYKPPLMVTNVSSIIGCLSRLVIWSAQM